ASPGPGTNEVAAARAARGMSQPQSAARDSLFGLRSDAFQRAYPKELRGPPRRQHALPATRAGLSSRRHERLPLLLGIDALDRAVAVRIGLVDAHDLLGLVAVVPGPRTGHGRALLGLGKLLALVVRAGRGVVGAHRRLLSVRRRMPASSHDVRRCGRPALPDDTAIGARTRPTF